jgi:hypothetical protein
MMIGTDPETVICQGQATLQQERGPEKRICEQEDSERLEQVDQAEQWNVILILQWKRQTKAL